MRGKVVRLYLRYCIEAEFISVVLMIGWIVTGVVHILYDRSLEIVLSVGLMVWLLWVTPSIFKVGGVRSPRTFITWIKEISLQHVREEVNRRIDVKSVIESGAELIEVHVLKENRKALYAILTVAELTNYEIYLEPRMLTVCLKRLDEYEREEKLGGVISNEDVGVVIEVSENGGVLMFNRLKLA